MQADCLVCADRLELVGVGQCDHKDVCALCHYKLRVKQGRMECTVCNRLNEEIIVTDDTSKSFVEHQIEDYEEFLEGGLFFADEKVKKRFEMQICNRCPFPECEDTTKSLNTFLEYKKHLNTRHKKHLW
jgi:hypothetical protein